ncbi:hypothetical protein NSK11_contig00003-0030 [Nocardia seriolae]|uniref:Uncharacterized protein n=1 Tax=Nocardia seriolae TaxID=37332 RepID=A0ABC9YKL9_9NOCA|nr:hypothetical protein NSK11_contig00003-0030 [Nocardia seriolae]
MREFQHAEVLATVEADAAAHHAFAQFTQVVADHDGAGLGAEQAGGPIHTVGGASGESREDEHGLALGRHRSPFRQ